MSARATSVFGIEPPLFDRRDIHVHVPEGATPKDGPSAGCRDGNRDRLHHDRHPGPGTDVAMTGEITLRGRVPADRRLEGEASGGCARRHQDCAYPRGQRQGSHGDFRCDPRAAWRSFRFARLDDVISRALVRPPVPIVWEEDTKGTVKPDTGDEAAGGLTAPLNVPTVK